MGRCLVRNGKKYTYLEFIKFVTVINEDLAVGRDVVKSYDGDICITEKMTWRRSYLWFM